MKSLVVTLFASLGLALAAAAQTFDEAVALLVQAKTIDGPMVGYDGKKSTSYRAYEVLRREASVAQLRALLRHENRIVRGYATRACLENDVPCNWSSVVTAHLTDTAKITAFSGCLLQEQCFGDYVFDLARSHGVLSAEQLLDLGERLVRDKSPLYAREWALRTLRFRDGMLHLIRERVKEGDGPAAIALARYGIARDAPLLIEHIRQPNPFDDNCRFLAAEIHPQATLLPALLGLDAAARGRITRDNPSRLRFWLKAIAIHQNQVAAEFLTTFVTQSITDDFKRRNLRQTMRDAIKPYQDVEAFAALRALLKE